MDWNNILSYAVKKVDKSIKLKDFTHITENGKWVTTEGGYWTGGFWVGLLWFYPSFVIGYEITKDSN